MGASSRSTEETVQGHAEIEQYHQTFDDVSNRIHVHQRSGSHRKPLCRGRRRRRNRRRRSYERLSWAVRLYACTGRSDCHGQSPICYWREWGQPSRYYSAFRAIRCEPRPATSFPHGRSAESATHSSYPSSSSWPHFAWQRWTHGLLLLTEPRISYVNSHELLFRHVPISTPADSKRLARRRQQPFHRARHGSTRLSRRFKWVSHQRSQCSRTTISATKCRFAKCYELTNPPSFS